jgi:hypothetical protein
MLMMLSRPLQEAHARRGAHWTFDAEKFVDCVRSVRDSCGVKAPSFDHGVGDPVPNDIWITRDHRCVGMGHCSGCIAGPMYCMCSAHVGRTLCCAGRAAFYREAACVSGHYGELHLQACKGVTRI